MSGPQGKPWPLLLKTKTKRLDRARKLVGEYLDQKTTKAEPVKFQGMFSEIIIVKSEGGQKAVLQFRAEPLDIAPFNSARELMGNYCPQVSLLHDTELGQLEVDGKSTFYPVYSSYIEGTSWCDNPNRKKVPGFDVGVMKSLGKVLALCTSDKTVPGTVQEQIIDKLDKRLNSKNDKLDPFRSTIQEMGKQAKDQQSTLEKLPLFQSHMDLNEMNIMVDNDGQVTGIVDWELSPSLQPFGMGLHRIHDLAGMFEDGVWKQREDYDEMERGFWKGLMETLPKHHERTINDNLGTVQLALSIGVILNAFDFDTGGEYTHNATLEALPKLLTYRIPALRGNDRAYRDSPTTGSEQRYTMHKKRKRKKT